MQWSREIGLIVRGLFLVFASINCLALYNEYSLMNLALEDLQARSGATTGFVYEFSRSGGLGASSAAIIHIVGDLVILMLINMRIRNAQAQPST